MLNRVFISYAKEDIKHARKLYSFLKEKNLQPWMDEEKLLPGVQWDFEIKSELRKADFIIIILSSNSVSKRGYVQKEFRIALEYSQEKLDSDTYIIPIKIDNCEVPEKINKFHWISPDNSDFMEKILQSINAQIERYSKHYNDGLKTPYGVDYKVIKGDIGNKSPKQIYEFKYQLFLETSTEYLNQLNKLTEGEVVSILMKLHRRYFEYLLPIDSKEGVSAADSVNFDSYEYTLANPFLISSKLFNSSYLTGSAHGTYGMRGRSYYTSPLREFDLFSLFKDDQAAINTLCKVIKPKIVDYIRKTYELDTQFNPLFRDLEPKRENFDNYYFTPWSLTFIYNPYELTPGSFGDQQPELTFSELKELFQQEPKLIDFISRIEENQ